MIPPYLLQDVTGTVYYSGSCFQELGEAERKFARDFPEKEALLCRMSSDHGKLHLKVRHLERRVQGGVPYLAPNHKPEAVLFITPQLYSYISRFFQNESRETFVPKQPLGSTL